MFKISSCSIFTFFDAADYEQFLEYLKYKPNLSGIWRVIWNLQSFTTNMNYSFCHFSIYAFSFFLLFSQTGVKASIFKLDAQIIGPANPIINTMVLILDRISHNPWMMSQGLKNQVSNLGVCWSSHPTLWGQI